MSLYSPGAKKIASVMEVGSLNELDLITVSLANQIVPALTNSMPVEVSFSLSSDTAAACEIFIDDVLQNGNSKKITIDSGVHSIQFACKGYKTAENIPCRDYFGVKTVRKIHFNPFDE